MGKKKRKAIGYFAYLNPPNVVCDGDTCVISGSMKSMRSYIGSFDKENAERYTIKKTIFDEIRKGLDLGAAYCFDETSYNRFYPLASKSGINLGPEDFSEKGPTGFHFVRVHKSVISSN